jgi:hypothetical protein
MDSYQPNQEEATLPSEERRNAPEVATLPSEQGINAGEKDEVPTLPSEDTSTPSEASGMPAEMTIALSKLRLYSSSPENSSTAMELAEKMTDAGKLVIKPVPLMDIKFDELGADSELARIYEQMKEDERKENPETDSELESSDTYENDDIQ